MNICKKGNGKYSIVLPKNVSTYYSTAVYTVIIPSPAFLTSDDFARSNGIVRKKIADLLSNGT